MNNKTHQWFSIKVESLFASEGIAGRRNVLEHNPSLQMIHRKYDEHEYIIN